MRIALATYPGAELISKDDALLARAIRKLGGWAEVRVWSEPEVDWGSFDVVAVRTTWDYHRRLPEFLLWAERVSKRAKLLNPVELHSWNAHKNYLQKLQSAGVPVVPTALVEDISGLRAALESLNGDRVVLKPEVGACAEETYVVPSEDRVRLEQSLECVLTRGKALVQPYMKRVETEGETSLVWIDGEVEHAIQKRPKPGDFRVQIDHGGSNERIEIPPDGLDLAARCIEALPTRPTFARIDAVRGSSGELLLMELELIEPELMFEWAPESADVLAMALLAAGTAAF